MMIKDGASVPYFPLKITRGEDRWEVHNPVEQADYWVNDYGRYLLNLCNGWSTYDEIAQHLCQQYRMSPDSCRQSVDSILEPMTEAGMIWWRRERMRWIPTPPPQSVFWEVTWHCNLRCLHCVVSAGERKAQELTLAECKRLADDLARLGVGSVAFSGGEPLLRQDFFQIAEYVTQLGMSPQIATNGILIDQAIASQLKRLNFSVQVTINGSNPQIHDKFCGVKHAFVRAIQAITLLKQTGVEVTLATVATKMNVADMSNIVELADGLGVDAFRLIPFIPTGRGQRNRALELTPAEMREVTRSLLQVKQSGKISVVPLEFEHTFSATPGGAVDPSEQIGCDGARSYCTIGATGEVLPCSYFSGVEADSIRDKPLAWIWQHSRFLNYFRSLRVADIEGACRECNWLAVCRTGCKAANRAVGDLFGSNVHCWVACGAT